MLVLAGVTCIGLRAYWRYKTQIARGDSIWRLTYHVSFQAESPGARIHAVLPLDTRHARVFRHELLHSGLKTERLRPVPSGSREITAVTQRGGAFRMTNEFDIHLSPRAGWRPVASPGNPTAEDRAKYLRGEKTIQVSSRAVLDTLASIQDDPASKAELVERLFEYCLVDLAIGGEGAHQDAAGALQTRAASPLGRARAMVALCRASKVPARLVTGFEIKKDISARPHVWVEVLTNSHWEPYDPENGFARELPHNFLPVRRGGVEIVRGTRVWDLRSAYSIVRLPPPPGVFRSETQHLTDIFDLTRLPLEMHQVLSLILLMPFGALVTAIFRTIIGIRTFGTFTPTLLALSFVYADWRTGLVVFAAVLVLGLSSRALLDRLALLVVPRLSVILTLVVLCMIFGVSLLDYLAFTPTAQAVLLPMVILTMTIERFYVTVEQDDLRFALRLLGGTLLVAFCCYIVLGWEEVGRMILIHPEVHLITVAVLIMIGRYTGYRLTELWRFRDLVNSD